MRYPIGKLGTKEEYNKLWYSAQEYGASTDYGYHDGLDFNLKTGGDTDMGELLYAVGDGKIVYYHEGSHSNTGFGKHMVLQCGKKWFHYAHCSEITASTKDVKTGDVIGKLGKSGTQYAHLHFSVFKVDPKELRNGIDTIAKNTTELKSWWENPFEVLDAQLILNETTPKWLLTLLQERGLTLNDESEIRVLFEKSKKYDDEIRQLQEQVKTANEALSDKSLEVSGLTTDKQKLQSKVDELEALYGKAKSERDEFSWQNEKYNIQQQELEEGILYRDGEITKLRIDLESCRKQSIGSMSLWTLIRTYLKRK